MEKQRTSINEEGLQFLTAVLTTDISDFIDLTIEQIKKLPREKLRCVEQMSVTEKTFKNGNKTKAIKIKMLNKIKALEMLSKELKIANEIQQKQSRKRTPKVPTRN